MGQMKTYKELTDELVEKKVMSRDQRRKAALRMKKLARSSAFKAKVQRKKLKMADPATIHKRAFKKARDTIIQKYSGLDKSEYQNLPLAARMELDNRIVAKKGAAIQKIAKKLKVKIKQSERERLQQVRQGGDEE
jgi:hypothetical protein